MKLSKIDERWCRKYASENDLNICEVKKAIVSFFDDIVFSVRKLPFNNIRRIYSADALEEIADVYNIPYIGRIGPIYSKYVKWRKEESENYDMLLRKTAFRKHFNERVDEAVERAMAGERIGKGFLRDPVPSSLYHKVWLIDKNGKRKAARQLFKK